MRNYISFYSAISLSLNIRIRYLIFRMSLQIFGKIDPSLPRRDVTCKCDGMLQRRRCIERHFIVGGNVELASFPSETLDPTALSIIARRAKTFASRILRECALRGKSQIGNKSHPEQNGRSGGVAATIECTPCSII